MGRAAGIKELHAHLERFNGTVGRAQVRNESKQQERADREEPRYFTAMREENGGLRDEIDSMRKEMETFRSEICASRIGRAQDRESFCVESEALRQRIREFSLPFARQGSSPLRDRSSARGVVGS